MDGRVARGEQTRRAIVSRAADIATVGGLEGLTIGRLATELELSKSSVFAHYGSKEELQLAAVAHAEEVFREAVIRPALRAPRGLPRLRALFEHWIAYSRTRVFTGGCFFTATASEFVGRQGRVHDRLVGARVEWNALVAGLVRAAVEEGHLPAGTDPDQLAFEAVALARAANTEAVLTGDDAPYGRAAAGIAARLDAG